MPSILRFTIALAMMAALAHSTTGLAAPPRGDLSALSQLSASFEAVAERVRPAVVEILASGYAMEQDDASSGRLLSRERSVGSGVILDPSGFIVTNAHVVASASRIQVVLATPLPGAPIGSSILKPRGKVLPARVVGVDQETDLAVLKIAATGLPALELGDSERIRQGQLVLAFGNPLGLESSVTMGVVSAIARQLRPEDRMIYIQTDAPINPGSSGGPLVDAAGRVVGINTLIFSRSGGSEGVGFAAPSNIVRAVVEQLRAAGHVRRGEIGVRSQTLTPGLASGLGLSRDGGVILSDVLPGGPAFESGLEVGDLVLTLDGKPMENARQFDVNLYRRALGSDVTLEVLRGSQRLKFRVPVRERPGDPTRFASLVDPERNLVDRLGILALDIDERLIRMLPPLRRKPGVLVAASNGTGAPGQDPLQPGDVVYAINEKEIGGVAGLREAIAALDRSASAVLQIQRQGELRYLVLDLE